MNIYAILAPMSERTVLFFCLSVYWRGAGRVCVCVCLFEEAVVWWKSSGRFVSRVLMMMIVAERVCVCVGGGQVALASFSYVQPEMYIFFQYSHLARLASKARFNYGLSNHPWLINEDGNLMRGHANCSWSWSQTSHVPNTLVLVQFLVWLVNFYRQGVQTSVLHPNATVLTS